MQWRAAPCPLSTPFSLEVQGTMKVKVKVMQALSRELQFLKVVVTERMKNTIGLIEQVA